MMEAKPAGLPKGWVCSSLGEISEVILGQSPPSSTYNQDGNGLPFYQGKLEFGKTYPSPQKWCSSPKKVAEKNDVLISVRAPVGPTNICPETSCIGRGLAAIRPKGGIESLFVLYLIRAFENKIAGQGTGTTFNAITGSQLSGIEIPLPPLPEQHRIVAKIEELFTKLDAGTEALQKIKAQLKLYRQAVLKYAFEGKLTKEWREANKGKFEPASVLLERIREHRKKETKEKFKELPSVATTELSELPGGWEWARLGELINPSKEKTNPSKIKELPYIGLEHIEKDTGKLLGYGRSIDVISTKTMFHKGDLLYGKLRPYLNKVHVAECDGVSSTDILVFPKISLLSNRYLMHRLLFRDFVRFASQSVSGVQHPRVDFRTISQFVIQLPPSYEQQQIVQEIESRLSMIDELEKVAEQSLKQSERLRQSILKQAFEGKLVPQDQADEPAEKLLERISAEGGRPEANKKRKKRTKKQNEELLELT
jgi:type I restriction enzyme S subunit